MDYPDLLVESAVLWRFAYPPATDQRLVTLREAEIVQAARRHGKNLPWLRDRNLLPPAATDAEPQKTVAEAFALWQEPLGNVPDDREVPEELLLNFLHACVYLSQTRSLLWLAVETDRYSLPDLTKADLLDLLRTQITAEESGMNDAFCLSATDRSILSCESDPYRQMVQRLRDAARQIAQTDVGLTSEVTRHRP